MKLTEAAALLYYYIIIAVIIILSRIKDNVYVYSTKNSLSNIEYLVEDLMILSSNHGIFAPMYKNNSLE